MVERRAVSKAHYSPIEQQNDRRTAELGSKVQQLQFITVELSDEIKRQNEDLKVCTDDEMHLNWSQQSACLEVARLDGFDQKSAWSDTSPCDITHGIR